MTVVYASPTVQPLMGQRVTVPYPVGQAAQVDWAIVTNQTAWNLTVDQGGLVLGFLPAFVMALYATSAVGLPLGFTASGGAPAAGDGIKVTWTNEQPPGAFPTTIPNQSQSPAGVPAGQVALPSSPPGGSSQMFSIP
ncbi:MAG TPA: hypothetical protein VGH66_01470, partial [Acidimicrobiales bacterium]